MATRNQQWLREEVEKEGSRKGEKGRNGAISNGGNERNRGSYKLRTKIVLVGVIVVAVAVAVVVAAAAAV